MSEVDAWEQPPVQLAQLQHLVQVAQLVDLAHGLRAQDDVPKTLVVADGHGLAQSLLGDIQGLPPGALEQGPGVEHNPGGPHPPGGLAGGGDIADGLAPHLRVRVGQADEIGGVEGQGYPRLTGPLPQLLRRVLPDADPLAALVLIAVQPKSGDPGRSIQRGLIPLREGNGVARRAESCFHVTVSAHTKGLHRPSRRKGVSTAYRM